MRFIPERHPTGGSLVGNSYLSQFVSCPREWYNLYLRPSDYGMEQEVKYVGILPKFTSPNLIKGGVFHEGIAGLLLSGCRDGEDTGEWSIDRALAAAEIRHKAALPEYEDPEQADSDWQLVEEMLRGYHDRFGPNSHAPDYPSIRVEFDSDGKPLIEREFQIDLGEGGYVYTCRCDAIINHNGFLKVMEHKSSVPSWVRRSLATIRTNSQYTGECFVLWSLFPEEPIEGVLVNVVAKGRAANSKLDVAERETTTRNFKDLEQFRLDALDILSEIDERVGAYERYIQEGWPTEEGANQFFPTHGTKTGRCEAFSGCSFLPLCGNKGREKAALGNFRPRTREEIKTSKEWTG